ncbi:helix-turn-helix domain-containing protein [Paenibacillus phocaensis]|uniref:helix-turn-helix domain-containing protein n=1 Tax=Paenibacillus phocaensis TaxID=1776378 RepID=UPI000839CFC6|nr:helix-turn-helix domain-containing protein [Paenibacillus phocaensis]
MKRIPMMIQLGVILFCVMAVPAIILTLFSGTQILRYSEKAIADSSLAGQDANRRLNENALNNLAQDTVRLTASRVFDRIRPYETYAELQKNYSHVSQALVVLRELVNLNHRVNGVQSSYFYLNDADYVISTDKGITTLDRYESINWMDEALVGRRGISGVWFPRRLASGETVVSYVLPLNRLSTTTRGTIVVNLRESQIGTYLQSAEPGQQGFLLLDADGTILSHQDKALLLTDGSRQPYIQQILDDPQGKGYSFHELGGERLLYTWSRSELFDWWNVNIYSMDALMTKTHKLQRNIAWLTAVVILAGTVLTVFLATWLSKPVRRLVRTVRSNGSRGVSGMNELAFLDAVFKRMQEEEEQLYKLLREREQDARSLAVHRLLRGEEVQPAAELFPEAYSLVAVLSIDRYRRYVNSTNPETRSYHRYLIVTHSETLFPPGVMARCVYQGEGCFAVVINFGQGETDNGYEGIKRSLETLSQYAGDLLGHTVTVGVSSRTTGCTDLRDRAAEAMEVIKQRMVGGSGGISFWREEDERGKHYLYPSDSERRILNYLEAGDQKRLLDELIVIRREIQSAPYISYDNIMFIYHQLIGVTIKHLREKPISPTRIFAGRGNIYSAIASMDTLDELDTYMREFYRDILQFLALRPENEAGHGERILRYLDAHYDEEIVFEDMAKEIGISYSYMRKIVYEMTGTSLIDYINMRRIEKAKGLLLESGMTVKQIAAEVGYVNVQSFNRFFRKYEGMPPSSYKASKLRSSG